jgi:hypothetical protein
MIRKEPEKDDQEAGYPRRTEQKKIQGHTSASVPDIYISNGGGK